MSNVVITIELPDVAFGAGAAASIEKRFQLLCQLELMRMVQGPVPVNMAMSVELVSEDDANGRL
jgi:hypothetical protein